MNDQASEVERLFLEMAGKGIVPNKDRTVSKPVEQLLELDLHGRDRNEAAALVRNFIGRLKDEPGKKGTIVVGKGLHSPGLKPVLQEAVTEVLNLERGIEFSFKSGVFQVWSRRR